MDRRSFVKSLVALAVAPVADAAAMPEPKINYDPIKAQDCTMTSESMKACMEMCKKYRDVGTKTYNFIGPRYVVDFDTMTIKLEA